MPPMIPQRAILSQIQEVLTALRQNSRFSEAHQRQSPLLLNLCKLRSSVRESSDESFAELSCTLIVGPFLEVVKSEETSGAVTGSALGALSSLMRAGLFCGQRPQAVEAMSDIVDGVSGCRFEFTDARHDEVVKMQMLEVLHQAATCDHSDLLTDESMWNIVTEFFVHRNTVVHSLTLSYAAEEHLMSVVKVVFSRFKVVIEEQSERQEEGGRKAPLPPKGGSGHSRGFGLPIAVKMIAFLCAQLQVQSPVKSLQINSVNMASEKVIHEKDRSKILCLKLIHMALETGGGKAIGKCPPVQALVRDDVCHAMLTIGRGQNEVSAEALTEAMMIVRTLWDAPFRKFLKIQLESIFIGVFLQHLKYAASAAEAHGDAATHIIESAFDARVAASGNVGGGGSGSGSASGLGDNPHSRGGGHSNNSTGVNSSFTPKALEAEIILECLGDLTASASLFVDLFINFDCDLARSDVLETLVSLLSTCARSPAPALKAIRVLAMGTLLNGLKAMTNRCDHESRLAAIEPHHKHPLWLKKLRKRTLKVGALKFNEKPRTGLMALMADGLLPTPLTPESVVKFLRTAPGLNKEVVGSFLGEAGKSVKETTPTTFIGDTAIFHQQVLKCFATSFDFSGQALVVALRVFLSAFRLPGEAQQIDRVVQAFADEAFEKCIEPRAGILATADTVYLLAFSIIMLHTDLHNPNIRPEKRMTCADFIKNNTNYGQEISKGKDLPAELLESIFKQISEEEFETHNSAEMGNLSNAKWRDLLRGVEADPFSGMMLSPFDWHRHEGVQTSSEFEVSNREGLHKSKDEYGAVAEEADEEGSPRGNQRSVSEAQEEFEKARMMRVPSALPLREFVSESTQSCTVIDALELSDNEDDLSGGNKVQNALPYQEPKLPPPPDKDDGPSSSSKLSDQLDQGFGEDVVYAVDSMLLHLVWRPVMEATAGLFLLGKAQGSAANPDSLRQAVDASLVLAKLLAKHQMQAVFDTLVFMLCGFTGLLSPWPRSSEGSSKRNERGSPLVTPSVHAEVSLLRDLVGSPSARMAAVAVFGIAHRLGSSLRHGWQPILRLIFRMRDLHILDPGMLVESDGDLLDPLQRRQFNAEVLSQRKRLLRESSQNLDENKGGLLRWIFGGGGGSSDSSVRKQKRKGKSKQVELWNHGAHTDSTNSSSAFRSEEKSLLTMSSGVNHSVPGSHNMRADSPELSGDISDESWDSEEDSDSDKEEMELLLKERHNLRVIATQQVAACQVGEIIWDSRELSETGLWALLHSLTAAIHAHLPPDEMTKAIREDGSSKDDPRQVIDRVDERVGLLPMDPQGKLGLDAPREVYLPPLSSPCLPFAEVLLCEISLRNRDRVSCTWPMLREHYKRRLEGTRVVSFGVEKAVTGLLRIVARVASRPGMATQMLSEALSWLLPPHTQPEISRFLSVQLGYGMLRIVRHTDAFVELPPHHWDALFSILQTCSESNNEGSVRGFEALCVVLHEPRLRTCVPATSVVAVNAFLTSPTSSEPLAVAAVDLLTVLHTRLAIIATANNSKEAKKAISETESLSSLSKDSEVVGLTRSLWASCWSPVIESMVRGCRDKRLNVRLHSLSALRDALVKDRHVRSIERTAPEEMHRLIVEVLTPLAEYYFPSGDDASDEEGNDDGEDGEDDEEDGEDDEGNRNDGGAVESKSVGDKEVEGYELVSSPPPSEKRAVESRIITPHLFDTNINLNIKEQVIMLEILCKSLCLHLKSVLPRPWSTTSFDTNPPFHELWNSVLTLLTCALHGSEAVHWCAVEHIKVLLLSVAEMGGFMPGDDTVGRELWEFTWTVLQHSAGSSGSATIASIQSALFPGCDFTHPPCPSAVSSPEKLSALASLPVEAAAAITCAESLTSVLPPDFMALLIESG